jgi:hypothetical protein
MNSQMRQNVHSCIIDGNARLKFQTRLSLRSTKQVDIGVCFAGRDCDLRGRQHDECMSTRPRSSTPDLFSSPTQARSHSPKLSASSPTIAHPPPSELPSRHVLPADLPNAVRHLDDQELDRLLSAVIAEQKRRGKQLAAEIPRKRRVEVVAARLTQGKLNAVRAAFKAAVSPSRIARQFGISQSEVRKALASDTAKR